MLNHISFIDHFKIKKTKNANKCQRYACFCVFECAGTDIVHMDKTEPKPTKRARESEESQNTEPGMEFS